MGSTFGSSSDTTSFTALQNRQQTVGFGDGTNTGGNIVLGTVNNKGGNTGKTTATAIAAFNSNLNYGAGNKKTSTSKSAGGSKMNKSLPGESAGISEAEGNFNSGDSGNVSYSFRDSGNNFTSSTTNDPAIAIAAINASRATSEAALHLAELSTISANSAAQNLGGASIAAGQNFGVLGVNPGAGSIIASSSDAGLLTTTGNKNLLIIGLIGLAFTIWSTTKG